MPARALLGEGNQPIVGFLYVVSHRCLGLAWAAALKRIYKSSVFRERFRRHLTIKAQAKDVQVGMKAARATPR